MTRADEASPDGENVLLLAPSLAGADEECVDLLGRAPSPTALLYVTLVDSPGERLAAWRTHAGEAPAAAGFVAVGGPTATRSAAASGDADAPAGPVETVPEPSDLTGLGIAVGKFVDRWRGECNLAVCLHSLTPLVQHAGLERAFQFLHVLTGRLRRAGAVAHFHLDPAAHDRQAVRTLYPLFDTVARVEGAEQPVPTP